MRTKGRMRPGALPALDDRGLPRAFGRFLTVGVVALVLAVGGTASVLLYRQADANAAVAQRDVATRVAKVLQSTSDVIEAGFSGANALVRTDGTVNQVAFRSFATEVARASGTAAIGFEAIVNDGERAAWEARVGHPIQQAGPYGGLVVADQRPVYSPVEWVEPTSAAGQQFAGFDFMSDPVRAAALRAARDTTMTVFSEPGVQQPDGSTAFFVVHALFRPDAPLASESQRRAAFVGSVSSTVSGAQLLEVIGAEVPRGTRVEITDGEAVLASTAVAPRGGDQAPVAGGGRPWMVTVDTPAAGHLTALMVALGTVLSAVLVGLFLERNRRQTEQLRASARAMQELGLLSERLAGSENVDQLADIVATHAAPMVGAQRAVLAVASVGGGVALVRAGSGGGPVGDRPQPLLEAWSANRAVIVTDRTQLRSEFPDEAAAFAARGVEAVAAYPLHQADGEQAGVLAFEWSRRRGFDLPVRSTLAAATELCQQHVARMQSRTRRRSTALALSMLGQRLSVARTFDEVAAEVVHHAPSASGAPVVVIGFFNAASKTLRLLQSGTDSSGAPRAEAFVEVPIAAMREMYVTLRRGRPVRFETNAEIDEHPALRALIGPAIHSLQIFPLLDSSATLVALVAFVHVDTGHTVMAIEPGRAETIADLTAQTIERATLYQRQHELVMEMQRRTLTELPDVAGMRVAARYRPSSLMLGLGGDWYDVQPLPAPAEGVQRTGLVVGDVVGHGIEAVADMTEIRTTVSTLLRNDPSLSDVVFTSSSLIASVGSDDVVFATAALLLIDIDEHAATLTYVRAGHPPPLLRSMTGGIRVLDAAGTTPIGVIGPRAVEERVDLESGDVLVVYTDGLIERRGETLDEGIDRLRASLAGCDLGERADPDRIADTLVADLIGERSTEDDSALVVVVID